MLKQKTTTGPVQRRPVRLQPPPAGLSFRRRASAGRPAFDVRLRGAERGEGRFGARFLGVFPFFEVFVRSDETRDNEKLTPSLLFSLSLSLFKLFSLLTGPRRDCEFCFLVHFLQREEEDEEDEGGKNSPLSLFSRPRLPTSFQQQKKTGSLFRSASSSSSTASIARCS